MPIDPIYARIFNLDDPPTQLKRNAEIDPIFEPILSALAPPTEKELTAIRSMTEGWKNPELEVIALKVSRLSYANNRREVWAIIDELKAIDARWCPKSELLESGGAK